jgi:hypothetical protein
VNCANAKYLAAQLVEHVPNENMVATVTNIGLRAYSSLL